MQAWLADTLHEEQGRMLTPRQRESVRQIVVSLRNSEIGALFIGEQP